MRSEDINGYDELDIMIKYLLDKGYKSEDGSINKFKIKKVIENEGYIKLIKRKRFLLWAYDDCKIIEAAV